MSGRAIGPPEWPEPGGLLNQDAKLVEAVELLRNEWEFWLAKQEAERKRKSDAKKERNR